MCVCVCWFWFVGLPSGWWLTNHCVQVLASPTQWLAEAQTAAQTRLRTGSRTDTETVKSSLGNDYSTQTTMKYCDVTSGWRRSCYIHQHGRPLVTNGWGSFCFTRCFTPVPLWLWVWLLVVLNQQEKNCQLWPVMVLVITSTEDVVSAVVCVSVCRTD